MPIPTIDPRKPRLSVPNLPVRPMTSPISPQPPFKRKREDEKSPVSRSSKPRISPIVDEKHWASDGNVVLQLNGTRFKLHRSRLIQQSCWFRTLFNFFTDRSLARVSDFHDRENMEHVLRSHMVEDGVDFFILDCMPHGRKPSANSFSELLSAMDSGIKFAQDSPGYKPLSRLLIASTFFAVPDCQAFARQGISNLFPSAIAASNPSTTTSLLTPLSSPKLEHSRPFSSFSSGLASKSSSPSFVLSGLPRKPDPFAAHAIFIARNFNLPEILCRAFYDLARSASLSPNIPTECAAKFEPEALGDINKLCARDHFLAIGLQKRFQEVWDEVARLLCVERCSDFLSTTSSSGGRCGMQLHHIPGILLHARKAHTLDPIVGINILLSEVDWVAYGYCQDARRVVTERLDKAREKLWQEITVIVANTV